MLTGWKHPPSSKFALVHIGILCSFSLMSYSYQSKWLSMHRMHPNATRITLNERQATVDVMGRSDLGPFRLQCHLSCSVTVIGRWTWASTNGYWVSYHDKQQQHCRCTNTITTVVFETLTLWRGDTTCNSSPLVSLNVEVLAWQIRPASFRFCREFLARKGVLICSVRELDRDWIGYDVGLYCLSYWKTQVDTTVAVFSHTIVAVGSDLCVVHN